MAIAPNTTFVANTVLTAAQQNAFGFGLCQLATSSTSAANVTATEVVQLTASFTAIANRYYKISYYEPDLGISGVGSVAANMRLRNGTTTGGTILQLGLQFLASSSVDQQGLVIYYGTFTAGAQSVVGTLSGSAVPILVQRAAAKAAFLTVEDVGPS